VLVAWCSVQQITESKKINQKWTSSDMSVSSLDLF
jgi:hypothetical protein